jgi:LuxR family maltose regulon positive regulatory protein
VLNASLWVVQAWLLEAIARETLGDAGAARRALEQALNLAKPEDLRFPFLLDPAPGLLERHRRLGTAHAALISEILNVLGGRKPTPPPGYPTGADSGVQAGMGWGLREPLSQSEVRVLRYLPTKLSAPEIADQLYLSVNTVKTHMRHLYDKLGAHRRHEAVEQARALGLLAPPPRRR